MSRILRRPMFRGGKVVSSYGNGIASGLTNKPKRGLVNEPGGYAGEKKGMDFLFENQQIPYRSYRPGNSLSTVPTFEELQSSFKGGNYANRNLPEMFIQQEVGNEDGDIKAVAFEDFVVPPILSDQQKGLEKDAKSEDTRQDSIAEREKMEIYETGTAKPKVKEKLLSTGSILENQNTANEELTLEEIKDTLGYKKAFRRDLGDTLARTSAAFLKTGDVKEGFAELMDAESKAGPGRAEKIETAAATFMLKNKAQSKRDKANIELMKSKIDYQIEAGESVSLPKSLLLSNKSGMLNPKELSVGIQAATSPITGKNYNFKGIVTKENLNEKLKTAKPGDTYVVTATIKDQTTGADKTIKSIVEINLKGEPVRIYNIA